MQFGYRYRAYEKWVCKATAEIRQAVRSKIIVSTLLEELASEKQRAEGLDIADYIIEELMIGIHLFLSGSIFCFLFG